MKPTVEQVTVRIQQLLDDTAGRWFPTPLAFLGYQLAYEHLRQAMIVHQIPAAVIVTTFTLPANANYATTEMAAITNFGELVELAERRPGTNEDWVPLIEGNIRNGTPGTTLGMFEWRGDAFWFVGATTARELRIRYYDSGEPPVSGSVGIDGSLEYLGYYGAAEIGPTKGYDAQECQRYRVLAIGPNLDDRAGFIHTLLHPMVRGLSRVQRQQPAYGVRASWRRVRPMPYIAAPPATAGVEQVLTISGVIDGENAVFMLNGFPQDLDLYRNGLLMYPGVAYTLDGPQITFLPDYIPRPGDLLRAKGTI
jgi:hypothetical protein